MNETLTYRLAADTHIGMQRSSNQDAFARFELPGCDAAFVVADGMGGLYDGERASQEAVLVIERTLQETVSGGAGPAELAAALREAFRRANDAVLQLTRTAGTEEPTQDFDRPDPGAAGALMGTTAVVGILKDGVLHLAHAGDSRAYRLRAGTLERLTEDHSFVAERVKAGDMTEAEARRSRYRNMITRAIGIDRTINPDLRVEPLQPGDLYLICSDGLTTMLEDEEIARQLASGAPPERQVPALIEAANRRGGTDNTTVLVLSALRPGEILAPQALRPPEPPHPTPETAIPAPRADVLDMDRRPRSRRKKPTGPAPLTSLLAAVGGVFLLLLFGLALSESLRTRLAASLSSKAAPPTTPTAPPLADLIFEEPERLVSEYLVRNDRLAYSPKVGLIFVRAAEGHVIGYDLTTGRPTKLVQVPPPDSIEDNPKVTDSEVYLTADVQGNVYVSSPKRRVIEKFDPNGKLRTTIGPKGLIAPRAIAVDEEGNVYVADSGYVVQAKSKRRPAATPAPKR